jgi:alcohol dehydrogenase class IV
MPTVQRQSMEEATAEAEARPLDYQPSQRATFIRTMLRDIAQWMSRGDSEESIRQRAHQFIEEYPELFKKIIQRQDLSPIQNMLSMLDRMAKGNLSQHQASIIVGQKLVDRYVTPQLNGGGSRTSEH